MSARVGLAGDVPLDRVLAVLRRRALTLWACTLLGAGANVGWNLFAAGGYFTSPTATVVVQARQTAHRALQGEPRNVFEGALRNVLAGYAGEEVFAVLESRRLAAAVLAHTSPGAPAVTPARVQRFVDVEREVRLDPHSGLINIVVRADRLELARARAHAFVALLNAQVRADTARERADLGQQGEAAFAHANATEARTLARLLARDAADAVLALGVEAPVRIVDEVDDARDPRARPDMLALFAAAGALGGLALGWLLAVRRSAADAR